MGEAGETLRKALERDVSRAGWGCFDELHIVTGDFRVPHRQMAPTPVP